VVGYEVLNIMQSITKFRQFLWLIAFLL